MRKLFFVSIALPMVMLFLACGGRTKAEAEADSLKNVLGAQLAEMTEMDLFIDAVNANMDSVMRLEGIILRTHGESKLSRKDQILQNIDTYREVLDRQRLRLAELEKKLKETDNQNEKLQKTVDALKNQIDKLIHTSNLFYHPLLTYHIQTLGNQINVFLIHNHHCIRILRILAG